MTKSIKNRKRVLSKKVTSFNLYVDQANQIDAIMEATGVDRDAQVLRDLLDEALAARRRKIAQQLTLPEATPAAADPTETLETIETLLLKLIEQGEKARGIRGICLELLQETLAEARAGRTQIASTDVLMGDNNRDTQNGLHGDIDQARHYAYALAAEIAKRQNSIHEASSYSEPGLNSERLE